MAKVRKMKDLASDVKWNLVIFCDRCPFDTKVARCVDLDTNLTNVSKSAKCVKMCKMCQNVPKCVKMCQNLQNVPNVQNLTQKPVVFQ